MGIEDKLELYNELMKGIKSFEEGKVYSAEEVFSELEEMLED